MLLSHAPLRVVPRVTGVRSCAASPSPIVNPAGANRWVSHMLKLPPSMATGTVDDVDALTHGTFSDDIDPAALAQSDKCVVPWLMCAAALAL